MNAQLPPNEALKKSPTTVLLGADAGLDSLGLVELVMRVQRALAKQYGFPIAVAGEEVLSGADSPFRTVDSMVAYLVRAVEQARGR